MFNKPNIKKLRAEYKMYEVQTKASKEKLYTVSDDLKKALESLSTDVLTISHIDGNPWIYFRGSSIEDFEKAIEAFNKIREYL